MSDDNNVEQVQVTQEIDFSKFKAYDPNTGARVHNFDAEKYVNEIDNIKDVDALDKKLMRTLAQKFYFNTDVSKESFVPFGVVGHYNFNLPPVVTVSEDFRFILTPEILAGILNEHMEMRHCLAMHASQIGIKFDFFIVKNITKTGPAYETFINSNLVGLSEEGIKDWEYNPSYVGLRMKIDRPAYIDVVFRDIENNENRERLDGYWARYFVQMYLLSRGHPFWKDASKLSLAMAMKKRNKKLGKAYAVEKLV